MGVLFVIADQRSGGNLWNILRRTGRLWGRTSDTTRGFIYDACYKDPMTLIQTCKGTAIVIMLVVLDWPGRVGLPSASLINK